MAGQARSKSTVRWDSSRWQAALKAKVEAIPAATDHDLALVAVDIHNRAKELCPVRFGNLRSHIAWKKLGQGRYVVGVYNVPYALPVEMGSRHTRGGSSWTIPAQPFMRPAFAEAVYYFVRRMGRK